MTREWAFSFNYMRSSLDFGNKKYLAFIWDFQSSSFNIKLMDIFLNSYSLFCYRFATPILRTEKGSQIDLNKFYNWLNAMKFSNLQSLDRIDLICQLVSSLLNSKYSYAFSFFGINTPYLSNLKWNLTSACWIEWNKMSNYLQYS